ncbi:MAG: HopJ type III effector protein [Limnohabitans sp.]|nr:HopJ type III effector protein [Limnohabitans sp.]
MLSDFIDKKFQEVLTHIDENYDFIPTAFKNGNQYNEAGQNNGSCKVFSFAKLNNLSKEETLALFCEHYQAVLDTPQATDHQNIRNFMEFGWDGISFDNVALEKK